MATFFAPNKFPKRVSHNVLIVLSLIRLNEKTFNNKSRKQVFFNILPAYYMLAIELMQIQSFYAQQFLLCWATSREKSRDIGYRKEEIFYKRTARLLDCQCAAEGSGILMWFRFSITNEIFFVSKSVSHIRIEIECQLAGHRLTTTSYTVEVSWLNLIMHIFSKKSQVVRWRKFSLQLGAFNLLSGLKICDIMLDVKK